jgi:hypothetical protein
MIESAGGEVKIPLLLSFLVLDSDFPDSQGYGSKFS